ncbi:condensin complex non-SMC subunit Cnd1 [Savitreella phatthalungensis]
MDFDLAGESAHFADSGEVLAARDLSSLDPADRRDSLNSLVESLSTSPDNVLEDSIISSLGAFCSSVTSATPSEITKLTDLLSAGLVSKVMRLAQDGIEDLDHTSSARVVIEIYSFYLAVVVKSILAGQVQTTSTIKPKTTTKKSSKAASTDLNTPEILCGAFDAMSKVMSLRASKMWPTTSERDNLVSLYTKPAYLTLEDEQLMKRPELRMRVYKVICVSIKHYGQAFAAQTSVVQALQYFEHVADPVAELLQVLSEQYDYGQFSDEILRDLSGKDFNPNDNKGPKTIGAFLVKLSELIPRQVLKQIGLLANFLDSDSHYLRLSIVEICGNLIASLADDDASEGVVDEMRKKQIDGFFDMLEERFLDLNPYVRSRVLQVYVRLCDMPNKFPKRRQAAAQLAVQSLEDRSSHVRKSAIRLLSRLIQTHPFDLLHGPLLSLREWQKRAEAAQKELDLLKPSHEEPSDDLLEPPTSPRKPDPAVLKQRALSAENEQNVMKLQMTKRFYNEAIRFIEVLERGSELVCQLLVSKTKTEVTEAMDFFVVAEAYKLDSNKIGIRRMLHLIWTKATNDEGRGVTQHLLECYRGLFLAPPEQLSPDDAANYVAKNVISLTYGATLAELTSLEQLLKVSMLEGYIDTAVVSKLWQVFGVRKRDISKSQRRGAIIVLGMLALADHDLIVNGLDLLLQVAFGPIGQSDLKLMKYACVALQRLGDRGSRTKGRAAERTSKLPNAHEIFVQLQHIVITPHASSAWFAVAEQAINAIYALAEQPDEIASDIIRSLTSSVFGGESGESRRLADLLFVVGHVSVKQIVLIEACEAEFKRRKADASTSAKKASEAPGDDLDMVGGTSEDDFTDAMAHIREKELLFGKDALLARFGPLVSEVCKNTRLYRDQILQTCATMCLAKFMCVSATYCEANLPLLCHILEASTDPATRSNLVIAMGDMTVCFNHVLDDCSAHLYRRLRDDDSSVRKTCLMTLTFLVLAGQVKVKGQLGEMAKCLEDDDRRVADLARVFFTELSTKDNAIYNGFTDIFSLLSQGEEEALEEDALRRIIKFLLSFVERDKHAKQLAEKLTTRLPHCRSQRQWDDCAYALSCLPAPARSEQTQTLLAGGYQYSQSVAAA